jgi:putative transposase
VEESGLRVSDACRPHQISEQTYYRWKQKYGGMEVAEARRLKERLLPFDEHQWSAAKISRIHGGAELKESCGRLWTRTISPTGPRSCGTVADRFEFGRAVPFILLDFLILMLNSLLHKSA